MTLYEKARVVCGISNFSVSGVPSLGIPGIKVLDGGTGMNYEQLIGDLFTSWRENPRDDEERELMKNQNAGDERNVIENYFHPDRLNEKERKLWRKVRAYLKEQFVKNTTNSEAALSMTENGGDMAPDLMVPACFPSGMSLGATFNPKIVNDVGHALGREARAHGIKMLLGTPNINIHRDPLNGRLFEGFSEDPCLVSTLAPELVRGVEDEGVAANIKHFAANNQEKNRQGINETISERALNEIYFPGFKACVQKAKPASVMAAYNKINGTACTENRWLLEDILRKKWGFDGMVVSDWDAAYNKVAALKAGNDLIMPGPVDPSEIVEAVENGTLTEDELDKNVERVLNLIEKYGTPEKYEMSAGYIMDMSERVAYKTACESIVMLKNENDIFPLKGASDSIGSDSVFSSAVSNIDSLPEVVLCGTGAVKLYDCGTGSAGITTNKTSSIYEGLADNGINVSVGIPSAKNGVNATGLSGVKNSINTDIKISDIEKRKAPTYICVARVAGMEGNDRKDLKLCAEDIRILNQMVEIKRENPNVKLGLILNVSGPVELTMWEKYLDGIFCLFLPGMEGGHAMADILCGRVNPSGKLPLTFPKKYQDTPTYLNFPGDGYQVNYGEGIYVGYRYYDKKMVEPLYPFGYGLSYSIFSIINEHALAEKQPVEVVFRDGTTEIKKLPVFTDSIKISVEVCNLGPDKYSDGQEVVQLYISDPYSTISKPIKELKAFKKVKLSPGEKETVVFNLSKQDFASYDADIHDWVAEEGIYNILLGNSSRNIVCSLPVYLDCKSIYSYSSASTVKDLYENEITRAHMKSLCDKTDLLMADILSKYEYEPNTKFSDLVKLKCDDDVSDALAEFDMRVGSLKRV